jgi:integrase
LAHIEKITRPRKSGGFSKSFKLVYTDEKGVRHSKNFDTKAAADAERIRVEGQLTDGSHIPDRDSITVDQGVQIWIDYLERLVEVDKRDPSTIAKYRQILKNHIRPYQIARAKLSRLRTPDCQRWLDEMVLNVEYPTARKARGTLRTAIGHLARQGFINMNPMQDTVLEFVERDDDEVVIPEKEEVIAILKAAEAQREADGGRALAMTTLGFFGGLRPSELLGLERGSLSLVRVNPGVRISQRVGMKGLIGRPKRKASHRDVPLGPRAVAVLRQWVTEGLKDSKPVEAFDQAWVRRKIHMLFPAPDGKPISYFHFRRYIWQPLLEAAGITKPLPGEKPVNVAKYAPNVMRHFAASVWIEQRVPPKLIQDRIGHASIQTTMDVYGHLFRDPEKEQEQVAAAEESVFSLKDAPKSK